MKTFHRNSTSASTNAAGKRRIRYSAIFTDWQGVRRKVALGADRNGAIRKIYDLDKKNHAEVDFTEQKQKREARGMTLRQISGNQG